MPQALLQLLPGCGRFVHCSPSYNSDKIPRARITPVIVESDCISQGGFCCQLTVVSGRRLIWPDDIQNIYMVERKTLCATHVDSYGKVKALYEKHIYISRLRRGILQYILQCR